MASFIKFDLEQDTGKTKIWSINTLDNYCIGCIKWRPQWRKYCFFPNSDTVFDVNCLNEITGFIIQQMNERKMMMWMAKTN